MDKIKYFIESNQGRDILTVLIVLLVGIGSFELGRLSKSDRSGGLRLEYTDEYHIPGPEEARAGFKGLEATALSAGSPGEYPNLSSVQTSADKSFFASKRGKKYYPVSCSAGKTIKQENRIWFGSREEAETAGYELSGSCN